MKVVLFCGGLGMRLRDQSEGLPKPMVHIGYRPILWHVMKYRPFRAQRLHPVRWTPSGYDQELLPKL